MKSVMKDRQASPEARRLDPLASTKAASVRLSAGSWIILIVLLFLLVATGFLVYLGWTLADGIEVTTAGYVAMAAGVILSLVVGCGLMALIFYSNRRGYDEPPVLILPDSEPVRRTRPPRV